MSRTAQRLHHPSPCTPNFLKLPAAVLRTLRLREGDQPSSVPDALPVFAPLQAPASPDTLHIILLLALAVAMQGLLESVLTAAVAVTITTHNLAARAAVGVVLSGGFFAFKSRICCRGVCTTRPTIRMAWH